MKSGKGNQKAGLLYALWCVVALTMVTSNQVIIVEHLGSHEGFSFSCGTKKRPPDWSEVFKKNVIVLV